HLSIPSQERHSEITDRADSLDVVVVRIELENPVRVMNQARSRNDSLARSAANGLLVVLHPFAPKPESQGSQAALILQVLSHPSSMSVQCPGKILYERLEKPRPCFGSSSLENCAQCLVFVELRQARKISSLVRALHIVRSGDARQAPAICE